MLAACGGGGGGGSGSPAPSVNTQPAPKVATIVMQGDSTMYGSEFAPNGVDHIQAHPNAPEQLQTDLGAKAVVTNQGVPGARLTDLLTGTVGYKQPWAQYVKTLPQQVVVENFGINDSGNVPPDQFQQQLLDFIAQTQAAGKIPVLEQPNPICNENTAKLDALVAVLNNVAKQENVLLIQQYDYIKSLPNWSASMQECVHPVSLYATKGDREAAALSGIVQQLTN